jgi:hypothetical protein
VATQEHQSSGCQACVIEHSDSNHFVINMHTMHNTHLMHHALPQELIQPQHWYKDRIAWHHKIACKMKPLQEAKQANMQAKHKAMQAENQKKKAACKAQRPAKRMRKDTEAPDSASKAGGLLKSNMDSNADK